MSTTTMLLISFSFFIACAAFALIAQLVLLADAARDDLVETAKTGGYESRPPDDGPVGRVLENGLTRPPA